MAEIYRMCRDRKVRKQMTDEEFREALERLAEVQVDESPMTRQPHRPLPATSPNMGAGEGKPKTGQVLQFRPKNG